MNKKIISLLFLLILMVSITATYVYFSQKDSGETQYDNSDKTVNDADVANEIDDMFLEEDDEVEIGDIV